MLFRSTPELDAWRDEVRAFLRDEMRDADAHADPADLTGLSEEFERAHQRRAGARGFLGISAPVEYGGGGRPPSWKAVYSYEAAYHDAPSIDTASSLGSASVTEIAPPFVGSQRGCTSTIALSESKPLSTSKPIRPQPINASARDVTRAIRRLS